MSEIWEDSNRFLSQRMKTRDQLEKHLQSKGYDQLEIKNVLKKSEEYGYINDIYYSEVYLAHCIPKGHTFHRIKRDLAARGVSEEHILAGLERYIEEYGIDPTIDEFDRGMVEATKIIGSNTLVEAKLLAKVGRKLISLGYRSETVYAILGEFMRGKTK